MSCHILCTTLYKSTHNHRIFLYSHTHMYTFPKISP